MMRDEALHLQNITKHMYLCVSTTHRMCLPEHVQTPRHPPDSVVCIYDEPSLSLVVVLLLVKQLEMQICNKFCTVAAFHLVAATAACCRRLICQWSQKVVKRYNFFFFSHQTHLHHSSQNGKVSKKKIGEYDEF